jgi:hypothetical protein
MATTTIHTFYKASNGDTRIHTHHDHRGKGGDDWSADDYLNLAIGNGSPRVRAFWLRIEVSRDHAAYKPRQLFTRQAPTE